MPTTDLLNRIADRVQSGIPTVFDTKLLREAAAEMDRLRKHVARLRKHLAQIEEGVSSVHDEELNCEVEVCMDIDQAQAIAHAALNPTQ